MNKHGCWSFGHSYNKAGICKDCGHTKSKINEAEIERAFTKTIMTFQAEEAKDGVDYSFFIDSLKDLEKKILQRE